MEKKKRFQTTNQMFFNCSNKNTCFTGKKNLGQKRNVTSAKKTSKPLWDLPPASNSDCMRDKNICEIAQVRCHVPCVENELMSSSLAMLTSLSSRWTIKCHCCPTPKENALTAGMGRRPQLGSKFLYSWALWWLQCLCNFGNLNGFLAVPNG